MSDFTELLHKLRISGYELVSHSDVGDTVLWVFRYSDGSLLTGEGETDLDGLQKAFKRAVRKKTIERRFPYVSPPRTPVRGELEVNRCYNEDCLVTMGRMQDEVIDLTVTSPPYDGLRDYKGYVFDFEKVAQELFRVTKDGGVVVWVVGDETVNGSESGTSFQQALYFKSVGFKLNDTMIYNRYSMPNKAKRYSQDFEYMLVLSKGKVRKFNPIEEPCIYAGVGTSPTTRNTQGELVSKGRRTIKDMKKISNIWFYTAGKYKSATDEIAHEHPAIFPEKLAADHIISWCDEGDLVYDPFMGSGTTAKMAIQNNRNWVGSEISVEYCDIIRRRVESV